MDHLKIINAYLQARGSGGELSATGLPFIAISRQAGAGGHVTAYAAIGEMIKERHDVLFQGWHVFDREICDIVAKDPSLHASFDELLSERHRSSLNEFLEDIFSGDTRQYRQDKRTCKIVRLLATIGKVIIVGRAATFVTRDLPGGIHVRLIAPFEKRVKWMCKKLNVSHDQASRMIHKQDSDRRRMVKTYFSADIEDPMNYDAVWNTASVAPDEIGAMLLGLIKLRAEKKPSASASSS